MSTMETAYHEAGHVVAGWSLGMPPQIATIRRKGHTLGSMNHGGDGDSFSLKSTKKEAVICYAGRAAQKVLTGTVSWREAFAVVEGDADDRETATSVLGRTFPDAGAREVRYQRLAFWLVRRHWSKVVLMAEALLDYKILGGQEIEVLLDDELGRAGMDQYIKRFNIRNPGRA